MAQNAPSHNSIALARLRPTQLTVGMLQVKQKRQRLRALDKKPVELVEFILQHPVRVVLGPSDKVYVIDHHHLALALIKEDFKTAPMQIEADFSALPVNAFWKKMEANRLVHLIDAHGALRTIKTLPQSLKELKDDPYRSLAGFVRETGGFIKVQAPFAEFQWADYFRERIRKKLLRDDMDKAVREALTLASHKDARALPGYVKLK